MKTKQYSFRGKIQKEDPKTSHKNIRLCKEYTEFCC